MLQFSDLEIGHCFTSKNIEGMKIRECDVFDTRNIEVPIRRVNYYNANTNNLEWIDTDTSVEVCHPELVL